MNKKKLIGVVAITFSMLFTVTGCKGAENNPADNPDESYVISCLQEVEHVTEVSAVTEDNDPNGQLGKQGSYKSQVYFSLDLVNQDDVYGETVIEKGTDCGGSIEVYETEADANKRDEYLGEFDGSVLSSGYHTVVGTCVVRVSSELTASQQEEMATKIIESLTKGE